MIFAGSVLALVLLSCMVVATDASQDYDPMDYEDITESRKDPKKYGLQCHYENAAKWGEYKCPRMPKERRNWLLWGCCEMKPKLQTDCHKDKTPWPHEGGPYKSAGSIDGNPDRRHCLRCSEDSCKHKDFECWHEEGFEKKGMTDGHCEQYTWRSVEHGETTSYLGAAGRPGMPHSDLAYNTMCLACHILDEPVDECRKGWEQLCLVSLHELNRPRCEQRCTQQQCKDICNRNDMDYAGDLQGLAGSSNYQQNACSWTDRCIAKCVPRGGAVSVGAQGGVTIDRTEYRGYRFETKLDWDACGYDLANPCRAIPKPDGSVDGRDGNLSYNLRHFCPKWNAARRCSPGWLVAMLLGAVAIARSQPSSSRLPSSQNSWALVVPALLLCLCCLGRVDAGNTVLTNELLSEVPLVTLPVAPTCVFQLGVNGQSCDGNLNYPTWAMGYHADTSRIVVATGSSYQVFDIDGFSVRPRFVAQLPSSATKVGPVGPWVAVGSMDGKVRFVSANHSDENGPILETAAVPATGISGHVSDIAGCPWQENDAIRVAIAGHSTRLWEVADSTPAATLLNGNRFRTRLVADEILSDSDPVKSMACFELDEKTYLAASTGSLIRIWQWPEAGVLFNTANPRLTLEGHTRAVTTMTWLSTSGILASGSAGGYIALWRVSDALRGVGNPVALSKSPTLFMANSGGVTSLARKPGTSMDMLVSGGRGGVVRLWEPITRSECGFVRHVRKYLEGYNRETHLQTELSTCLRRCCDADWCISIDYQHTEVMEVSQDDHGEHTQNAAKQPSSRCILSDSSEQSSGQGLADNKAWDHYVLSRKSGLLQELPTPNGDDVVSLAATADTNLLITLSKNELRLWKSARLACPDGRSPDSDMRTCEVCQMGWAGKQGTCEACAPGKYQDLEGQTECKECPPGSYSRELGQPGCFSCPRWTLLGPAGARSCPWCPAGEFPSEDRTSCVSFEVGHTWQPGGAKQSSGLGFGLIGLALVAADSARAGLA